MATFGFVYRCSGTVKVKRGVEQEERNKRASGTAGIV